MDQVQALVELVAGFIALLAAAALSQFGVDLHRPSADDREVRRLADCDDAPPQAMLKVAVSRSDTC